MLLDIVRRQPVIVRADMGFEESPGAPREAPEEMQLIDTELRRTAWWRAADPPGQRGRKQPQRQDGRGHRQCAWMCMPNPYRHRRSEHGRKPHRAIRRGQIDLLGAFDFAGRIPLQQVPVCDEQTPQRAHDRIGSEPCFVRKAGQVQPHPRGMPTCRIGDAFDVHAQRQLTGLAQQRQRQCGQWRDNEQGEQRQRPPQRVVQRDPAGDQQRQQRRWYQAATQVIEHFPARQRGQRIAFARTILAAHARMQPRQQLPIATDPAVTARDIGGITRRIVFVQLRIAHQARACVATFEQVMAEDRVVRKASAQRTFERFDVVHALADERSFAEQVLVHVRCGARVGIDARFLAEPARITRTLRSRYTRANPRLQDAVATRYAIAALVPTHAIERMRERGDEFQRDIAWQPGVGVQGDHITHIA